MMVVLSEAVGSALGDLNIDPGALKAAQDARRWNDIRGRGFRRSAARFANSATAAGAQVSGHV